MSLELSRTVGRLNENLQMRVLALLGAKIAKVLVPVCRDDLSLGIEQDVYALRFAQIDTLTFVLVDLFAPNHHERRTTRMEFPAIRGHQIDGGNRNTALLRAQRSMLRENAARSVSSGHRISPRTYDGLAISVPGTFTGKTPLFS